MAKPKELFEDRETALLDMLAGWLEMVESCRDAGNLPREKFDAEFFGDIVPETYEEWREHYTDEYFSGVERIYQQASQSVMGDEEEAPEISAADFLREYILPLFEEDTGE